MSASFAAAVQEKRPSLGLVLGSGLAPLINDLQIHASVSYEEIGGLTISRVPGHQGRFVLGGPAGAPLLIAQGRVHLYEGCSAQEVTAGVRWMHQQGIRRLILTNAAGTLNRAFLPGEWMMLEDHLNLTGTTPLLGGPNFVDMTETYSAKWRRLFSQAASAEAIPLHEGVYAGLLGPQYETPAEVRMLQKLGADAVGMSTVLEAIQARALGMEVLAFSCLTNWAAGLGTGELDHHEVLATGSAAAAVFRRLLARVLSSPEDE
jgi:purine-nucleoside phosphorylase